jgi:hypothetical protein
VEYVKAETILYAGRRAFGCAAAAAGWIVRASGVTNNVNRSGAACPHSRERLHTKF